MIWKYLQGGTAAIPPLVSYTPVAVNNSPTGAAAASSKSSSADLTEKDIFGMLEKLDGLPSDITALSKQLASVISPSPLGGLFDTASIQMKYLLTLTSMKLANAYRKEYDEAFKIVSENGGLNELAINDRGLLIGMNEEGDFKYLRSEELTNETEYRPLTNSELLSIRAHNLDQAFQSEIPTMVRNGIGMAGLNKLINDIISNLGSSLVSKEGYSARENNRIISGLELLLLALTRGLLDKGMSDLSVDGLYKNNLLTKDLALLAQSALNYLYRVLPENAKTLLKVKSDGSDKGVYELLGLLVSSRTSAELTFTTDLEKDLNSDGSKKSDKGDEYNPAVAFLMGWGTPTLLSINAGTADTLKVLASLMPTLKKDGTPLGRTTLDKISTDSVFNGIFDFSLVTMGNLRVDMTGLQNVIVDAGQVYRAYLPIDRQKAMEGVIAPDLNLLANLELINREIKETGAETPEEKNAIYAKYNMENFFNPDGSVNESYYKVFGVMNGTALSDAFKKGTDFRSMFFNQVDDDNIINNAWDIIKGLNSKEEFDSRSFWNFFGGKWQEMVEGLVYLPMISIDPTLGSYSGGTYLNRNEYTKNKIAMQQEAARASFNPLGLL